MKEEFLKKLRIELSELRNKNKIDDVVAYYDKLISSNHNKRDFIATLDPKKIAKKIIKEEENLTKETNTVDSFTNKIISFLSQMSLVISKMNRKELLSFILNLVILILFILFLNIPVAYLINYGKDIFSIFMRPFNRVIFSIWRYTITVGYIAVALSIIVRVFKMKYLKDDFKPKKVKENSVFTSAIRFSVYLAKIISLALLILVSGYLVVTSLAIFLSVYLITQGVFYIGFYLIALFLFHLGINIFKLIYAFVIDKSLNPTKILKSFLISLIGLGVSGGIALINVSNTKFIDEVPEDLEIGTLEEELTMTKDTVFLGNISNYEIDESLNDKILVIYNYYPLLGNMKTNITKKEKEVTLAYTFKRINISTEFIDHIVKNLKENKIYNYNIEPTITIKSSEKNIKQIRNNRHEYYKDETKYHSCEFIRTYKIELIKTIPNNTEEVNVTISSLDDEELESVKLNKTLTNQMRVGSAYEFTFQSYEAYLNTDISSLFTENTIKDIKEVTIKDGIEPRMDKNCIIY